MHLDLMNQKWLIKLKLKGTTHIEEQNVQTNATYRVGNSELKQESKKQMQLGMGGRGEVDEKHMKREKNIEYLGLIPINSQLQCY